MATIAEIRAQGTELEVENRGIEEPLTAPESLKRKLERFPEELYNLHQDSHLFRFLVALCGEGGAGSIKKELLYSKLQSRLESTHFDDLDKLYGNPLALPRLSDELYTFDPMNEILTHEEWVDIWAKDAMYRNRALIWMRAIMHGPTLDGMKLAAEAATGYEWEVHEQGYYLENLVSDDPMAGVTNLGKTSSYKEFILVPRVPVVTEAEKRRVIRLIDRLRPVDTVPSIYSTGIDPRLAKAVRVVESSSDYSHVLRMVTGRSDIEWPSEDRQAGFWIVAGQEKEAPTYAWIGRQESATFLTISGVEESTEHYGEFNREQRRLFSHLQDTPDNFYKYAAENAYTLAFAQIGLGIPWVKSDTIVINNHYPLDYFTNVGIDQFATAAPSHFWASAERNAPEADWLVIDFERVRPVNYVDFEISQKPIDLKVETSTNNVNWEEIVPSGAEDYNPQIAYSSNEQPWKSWHVNFLVRQARYVRITFTRRDESWPFADSDPFRWSIDVRNLRAIHLQNNADDFVADSGLDILGNEYRTELVTYAPENVLDGETNTYWQSQPNPIRHAVESLYFDISFEADADPDVTMVDLDQYDMFVLGGRSMESMRTYFENAQVIDEIYIDPITLGCDFHIYFSNDDDANWDNKLWTPIHRHYKLSRGWHSLPTPVFAKYIKLEFTNLTPMPYNTLDYPIPLPTTYRRFPTWVQSYFETVFPPLSQDSLQSSRERITVNPYDLYQVATDAWDSKRKDILIVPDAPSDLDEADEIKTIITEVVATDLDQLALENQIRFFPPTIWQDDLVNVLDLDRAQSRFIYSDFAGDEGFMIESPITELDPPDQTSVTDTNDVLREKNYPNMWFPRKARHGYQVVEGPFQQKLAYAVAVREVSFWRRNLTVEVDEDFYIETFYDEANIQTNEFVLTGDDIFQVTD